MVLATLVLLFLAGCSTGDSTKALDGEGIYKKNCLSCHGKNLEGGTFGPPVTNMAGKYSEQEVLDMINNGIGKMPGKLVSEEQAAIVTKWLMEK